MTQILLQALGFLTIIGVAYFLKKRRIFAVEDGQILSKIIVNVTLPAAIIIGFTRVDVTTIFFSVIALGLLANILISFISGYYWRKKTPTNQAFMVFNATGYNIGNFTLPFVQSFFPMALPFLCIFDIGNAFMVSGGTSVIAAKVTGNTHHQKNWQTIIKRLLQFPPFTIYIILFLFTLLRIDVPQSALSFLQIFANGNAFLSMFMIGLFLEINIGKQDFKIVFHVLKTRYFLSSLFALIIYFCLPFPLFVRQSIVLALFSPIPGLATIQSVQFGTKESIAGFLNSASIVISTIIMTILMILFL